MTCRRQCVSSRSSQVSNRSVCKAIRFCLTVVTGRTKRRRMSSGVEAGLAATSNRRAHRSGSMLPWAQRVAKCMACSGGMPSASAPRIN